MELQSPEEFLAQMTRAFVDLVRSKDRTSSSYTPPRFRAGGDDDDAGNMMYREMLFRPEMSRETDVVKNLLASFRAEHGKCLLAMIILVLSESDHVFLIGRFIELDPGVLQTTTTNMHPQLLHLAIFAKNLALMQLLLDNGVDVDSGRDNEEFSCTPLEYAIWCPAHASGVQYSNHAARDPCFLAGVKLLVEFGADTVHALRLVEQLQYSIYVSASTQDYYETMCPQIKKTITDADPFLFPLLK